MLLKWISFLGLLFEFLVFSEKGQRSAGYVAVCRNVLGVQPPPCYECLFFILGDPPASEWGPR